MPEGRENMRVMVQVLDPGMFAKEEQVWKEARIMSTPWVLMGEVAGRNTKGMASVMLAEGGKEMREDRATVEFTDTLELHCRVVVVVGA